MHRVDNRAASSRLAVAALFVLALVGPACLAQQYCPGADIEISGASASERALVCECVELARSSLTAMGLSLPEKIRIDLVGEFENGEGVHALARYDARRNAIELLDLKSAIEESGRAPPAFGIPMSRELWRSYVVHELAHAAAIARDKTRSLTRAQHEYIAAVVQLGTLPEAIRATILRNYGDLQAFGGAAEISDLYYLMNPCAFAVKAYLHFSRPDNGAGFVFRLFEGTAR